MGATGARGGGWEGGRGRKTRRWTRTEKKDEDHRPSVQISIVGARLSRPEEIDATQRQTSRAGRIIGDGAPSLLIPLSA